MKKTVAMVAAAALVTGVSAASINGLHADTPPTDPADQRPAAPGEATGMVVQIDPMGETISVDGIDYMVPEHVSVAGLDVGDEVTVRYEPGEITGTWIATEIMPAD